MTFLITSSIFLAMFTLMNLPFLFLFLQLLINQLSLIFYLFFRLISHLLLRPVTYLSSLFHQLPLVLHHLCRLSQFGKLLNHLFHLLSKHIKILRPPLKYSKIFHLLLKHSQTFHPLLKNNEILHPLFNHSKVLLILFPALLILSLLPLSNRMTIPLCIISIQCKLDPSRVYRKRRCLLLACRHHLLRNPLLILKHPKVLTRNLL